MERKTVTAHGRKKGYKGEYELNFTPDEFRAILDSALAEVPEEFRDSATIVIGVEDIDQNFELLVHAQYERPESDRAMNARIEREIAYQRRVEEAALQAEQERAMLAAKAEEEDWQKFLVLYAKFGSKLEK